MDSETMMLIILVVAVLAVVIMVYKKKNSIKDKVKSEESNFVQMTELPEELTNEG